MKIWKLIKYLRKAIGGAPDAVKVACPVLVGGKAGDYIKGLPIDTSGIFVPAGYFPLCMAGVRNGEKELPYGPAAFE